MRTYTYEMRVASNVVVHRFVPVEFRIIPWGDSPRRLRVNLYYRRTPPLLVSNSRIFDPPFRFLGVLVDIPVLLSSCDLHLSTTVHSGWAIVMDSIRIDMGAYACLALLKELMSHFSNEIAW